MRARARATVSAFAERAADVGVVYASKAFPCTAALRLFAEEGLLCDVASGGELHLALRAGFDPERLYMHGNNKTEARAGGGARRRRGAHRGGLARRDRAPARAARRPAASACCCGWRPGIEPDTHAKIATGGEDSKFGVPLPHVPRAIEACHAAGLELRGLHSHIGSQVFDLDVYETLGQVLTELADLPVVSMGGGFAVAYTRDQRPPAPAGYAEAMTERAARRQGHALRARPLAGGQRVRDALHGRHRQGDPRACAPTWRWTAACRTTFARCSTTPRTRPRSPIASARARRAGSRACTASPATCWCPRRALARPAPWRRRSPMPATGAYGHAMASNYNAVPRPPVVFCRDGDARVVVRRETYDDLTLREPEPFRVGLLGHGTVGAAFEELASAARRRDRRRGGAAAGDLGCPDPQPGRLRRHPASAAT